MSDILDSKFSLTGDDSALMSMPVEREVHLMVDNETLGVDPDAPIVAIAAIAFEPDGGRIVGEFYRRMDLTDVVTTSGAVIHAETVKWWFKQTPAALLEMVGTLGETGVSDIRTVLREFGEFVQRHQKSPRSGIKHWANGANFDPVMIDATYKRLELNSPLNFWKSLDVRTIVELGRQLGIDPKNEAIKLGVPHKALEDCRLQVQYVSELWGTLLPPVENRKYAYPQFTR